MRYLVITAGLMLASCGNSTGILEEVTDLNAEEISGIEVTGRSPYIWAIEDHGNAPKIYGLSEDGTIAKEITIANAKNNDWEDVTSDSAGDVYIGDFGNNDNDRRDLAIYRIAGSALDTTSAEVSAVTRFHYPEQNEFPPRKSGRFFDVEAFYEHGGSFYLFTKNRSSRFDGSLSVYKVPNKQGEFPAEKIGELSTCGKFSKCAVTGADISPDGKTVVLLAADRLWLVTGFTSDDFGNAKMELFELGHETQKEGICFKDDDTLLIADEKEDNTGGKLYSVSVSALKSKAKAE